jgi:hypothetical protein
MGDAAIAGRTANAVLRYSTAILLSGCRTVRLPGSAACGSEWFRRQIPRSIMATTWVNQITKKRRKMLEIGHFNSFSNI